MFTPPGQDPAAVKTILFVFVLAMLASICSRQMAHGAERFLPSDSVATIALRPDASITGDDIRLRQIARWSDNDKAVLDPIGDLIVARFGQAKGFRNIDLIELKGLLTDAGVNLATVNFVGPMTCRIDRTDVSFAPGQAIEQYAAMTAKTVAPAASPAAVAGNGRTLRSALTKDLADRLHLDVADLQIGFKPEDEAALRRCEPHDTFDVRPQRTGDLGDVSWVVSVSGEKRLFIQANARAWRNETVANAPLAARQPITDGDVTTRRQLVDKLGPDPLLPLDKVVGQAAARDVKPGMVFTTKMVDPIRLVTAGQDVTVDTATGGVRLLTAARALSDGVMGQNVQLRNEQTRQLFNAVVTGPKRVALATAGLPGSVR